MEIFQLHHEVVEAVQWQKFQLQRKEERIKKNSMKNWKKLLQMLNEGENNKRQQTNKPEDTADRKYFILKAHS